MRHGESAKTGKEPGTVVGVAVVQGHAVYARKWGVREWRRVCLMGNEKAECGADGELRSEGERA